MVKALNTAGGSKFSAAIDPTRNAIKLTDTSGGGGAFSGDTAQWFQAAHDLGLDGPRQRQGLAGQTLIAGLDSVLVSSLNGGSGLPLGQISITDRRGMAAATVDLSAATSVQDILSTINNTAGNLVTASLNSAGNGIQIADRSGGTGNLVIGDVNSTTAASLGIAGTFDASAPTSQGEAICMPSSSRKTVC